MAKTEINTEVYTEAADKLKEGCIYCSNTGRSETFYKGDGGVSAGVIGSRLLIGAGYGITGSFKPKYCRECGREL